VCKPAGWNHFEKQGGGGTVRSGDWTFCIVTLAALDINSGLDECCSQGHDQPSIDMALISNTHNEKYKQVFIDMFYGM
jgi:hypothetical protein